MKNFLNNEIKFFTEQRLRESILNDYTIINNNSLCGASDELLNNKRVMIKLLNDFGMIHNKNFIMCIGKKLRQDKEFMIVIQRMKIQKLNTFETIENMNKSLHILGDKILKETNELKKEELQKIYKEKVLLLVDSLEVESEICKEDNVREMKERLKEHLERRCS